MRSTNRSLRPRKICREHSEHPSNSPAIGEPRKTAQQMAYCFARMNISEQIGKEGNTLLYRFKNTRQKKNLRVFEEILPALPWAPSGENIAQARTAGP